MRRPFVAANWKMHLTVAEAQDLASAIRGQVDASRAEVAICAPFTCLGALSGSLGASAVGLGGQNMHWEDQGAFTGEISGGMLVDIGCRYVIVGHSERRTLFGETDEEVNRKLRSALRHGLAPILCVGERLEEREADQAEAVVTRQLNGALQVVSADDALRVTVAYEPVWAIGTGRVATPEQAQEMHHHVRGQIAERYGQSTADACRVIYGGSVKPDNAAGLFEKIDIDGGLIGGASLDAAKFAAIINAV